MNRILPVAIGLLLAFPAASAAPTGFVATSVRAVGPDPGVASGDVAVFLLEDLPPTSGAGPAPPVPPFTVESQALHVTTDYTDLAVRTQVTSVRPNVQSHETNYGVSALEETGNRDGYKVDVSKSLNHPAPLATLTNGCFEAGATDKENITRSSIVDDSRTPMTVPLGDGILFTSCGPIQPTLTVTGSFILHLWQTDVLLREGGRSQTLQSGHMPSSGQTSGLPADQGRDQELYIEVINGTLRTPFIPEGRLYLRGMDASLDGEVVLSHARGTLETGTGAIRIEDQNLRLRGGPMHLTAKGHGRNPMDVTVDGGWKEANLGGMVLASAQAPAHTAAAAPFALGLAALAALAASRRRA